MSPSTSTGSTRLPSASTRGVPPACPPGRRVQPPPPPRLCAVVTAVTVTCTVAGCGSVVPRASVQAKDTVKVPGVLNPTDPGFCSVDVLGLALLPKFHRNVNGASLSGSLQVPAKGIRCPAVMVMSAPGLVIWLSGG